MKYFMFKNSIKIALTALTLFICAESKAQLKLIHYWDMNNTLPAGGAGGTNLSPLNAEYSKFSAGSAYLSFGIPITSYTLDNGSSGSTLNEFHILGNDTSSLAADNLYIRARSPNTGASALFTWHLPTTNYENITVSFASELSSAGKGVLSFSYSTNGGTTYSVIPTACMTPTINPYTPGVAWGVVTINFSTLTGVNNNPNFIIAMTNTVVGATGNYRFDNIAVQGDTVQVSAQNTSCFGTGSAMATPVYGTAPYTYTWAPSGGNAPTATGLTAGNYTVSMTDANGIVATATVAVVLPSSPLVANISSIVNVKCFSASTGSAAASVSGGTAGYTYTWSPSGGNGATASGLVQGSYTLNVIDANSCTTNTTVTITQPASALSAVITSTNVNCFGNSTGSATGTASGGTAGYTYTWSPSGGNAPTASSLAQGMYTLNITDANSCTTNTTVTISQPAVLTAVITSTNVNCFGNSTGSANAAVSGGTAGYTYTWSPSGGNAATASSLAQGTYTINIKDANGCTTNTVVTITQPTAALSAGISANTNVKCFGNNTGSATATVSGGTSGYTYTWSPSGGNGATASGLAQGSYTLNVTDANGCTTNTTVAITQPAAALTASVNTTVNGGVCSGGSVNATVTVNGGVAGYTYTWSPSGGNSATTNSLSPGSYTIDITDANSCTTNVTLTVTPPASALSASISVVSNINCATTNTGSVTAVVSGGTPAYTYTWSPSGGNAIIATNLSVGTYTLNVTDANSCTTNTTVTITKPVVSINSSTNINCFGNNTGSASATVTGGTTGYTYVWSPSGGNAANASSLTAGTYTINVTDAYSCVTNTTVTITQPAAALNVAITSTTNVNCFGNSTGSASATVTGGTAAYTYTWSPTGGNTATASSLAQGSYTLNVTDAKNCTTNTVVTITQPAAALSASIGSVTNVNCFGNNTGSATATVSGGTAGYTYTWSPTGGNAATVSSLTAGTYTVNIKDTNSCTTNTTVTITQPASTISAIITSTNVACFGNNTGSANVAVSGGTAGYTYTWSPSGGNAATASALTAGTYTVNIKDANSCGTNTTVTITQSGAALSASISASTNVKCFGSSTGSATATVSGGTAGYTYTWSPSGGNTAIATNLAAGAYTVNIKDANSCTTNTIVTITQPATAVSASITASNNVTCYGLSNGTATVAATGGTGTYTYSWSNGQNSTVATNLSAAANALKLIYYWDMNNTTPAGGGGLINQSPLASEYPTSGRTGYLVFNNGSNSILDNGSGGATVNEFHVLGNDTSSLAADNYYVRARNPSYNVPFNWYMPTTNYKNIVLSYAAELSSAGKAVSAYAYSLDSGLTFQNTGILVNGVAATSYTPGVAWATVTIDLSSISGANNNPKFVFQVLNTLSTATTTSGNSRFDNIALQGDTINAGPTYIATVTDGNGCVNTASVTITQPTVLTTSVSSSTSVNCFNGNTGSATASVSGGNTSFTYTWSPSGGNAVIANSLTAGNYTVNVTDNKGCTASNTVTITQPTIVTASITANTNEQCNGGSTASANATATGGTPAYTYTWSPAGGNSLTASNLPAGTYTLNVTDNKGCPASTTVTITQPNAMTVSISTFTNVNCNGGSNGAATGTAIGGSGNYTYQWDDASNQTTATAINLSAGVYNCYVTDVTCGTLSSNSVTITQPNIMTASVTSFTNVACHGNNTGAATVAAASGSGTYSYQWNDMSNQTTATASNLIAETYSCVVTDVTCSTIVTKTVTITQPAASPTITIAGTNAICMGSSTTFTASGVSTYTWVSGPTTATYSVNPTVTTSYSVVGTNSVGCTSNMAIVNLTVNTLPNVSITATSNTVCAGVRDTLTAGGAITYTWSPIGGNATTISGSLTSSKTFTLSGTDANGCENIITQLITVNPLPTVTANSATVCAGTTTTLTATGATTYTWNTGATGTFITPSPTVTTNYIVTGIDGNNCLNSATSTVSVNTLPTLNISSSAICIGATATLTATGATSYTWNTGATGTTITSSPTVTTNYTVTGTDANNCTNTDTASVIVNSLPTIIVNSPAICIGTTATLTANGATSYIWNTSATSASITDSPTVTTNYTVTGSDGNNCTNSGIATITVNSLPTLTITASSATVCAGSTATLTASGANTYTWSNTGTMGTSITSSLTLTTNYTVTGTDGNNCMNTDTLSVIVNNCTTGVENNSSANNQVNVYPIPNNGAFTIELADDDYQMVKIYDEIGKEIYTQSLDTSVKNTLLKIDLGSLPNMNGMLTLQIITTSGVINKKIIAQK